MKTLLGTIIMIGCCVIITATDDLPKAETAKVKKTVDIQKTQSQVVSVKKNDISITASLKEQIYQPDKAIEFTVKLTNNSKENISFVSTNAFADFVWNVIDSATGTALPYTQKGESERAPYRAITRRTTITVKPGNGYSLSLDIAPYFDFQPGGKYELNFGGSFQQDGKKVDYQLKGLTIEIAPKKSTDKKED